MISKHCSLSGTNDKAGGPHYMLKWASPQVGCKCKSFFAQMQILFCTNANIVLQKCKSCFAQMQILSCKNANLVLQKYKSCFAHCKSCFAQMQILFCKNANIVLHKCKSCFAKMQVLFCTNANLALQKHKSCKFEENSPEIFQAVKQTFVPLPSVSYPYMNQ